MSNSPLSSEGSVGESPERVHIVTRCADDTRRLASAITPLLKPGDVIVLAGDLGAGKTTFVQGLGAGLGVNEPITSPTFILMKEYFGRFPLLHLDVYRLNEAQELLDLGYDEFLAPHIVAVEWGDVVEPMLPRDHLRVELEVMPDDDERSVVLVGTGQTWEMRMQTVRTLISGLFDEPRGDV